MQSRAPIRARKPSEDGYMLLAVIFMMVLLVLSLSVAAPRIAKSIQRDREVETMHRGKQYIRAIQLYYRKFGAYPPSLDALSSTNNMRFLRKKYTDPLTGKSDWKPVLFGQSKAPLAMGFFGQPLAGGATPIAGIGPGGSGGVPGMGSSGMPGAGGSTFGGGSSFGGPVGGGSSSIMGGGMNSSAGGGLFGGSSTDSGSSATPASGAAPTNDQTGQTGQSGAVDANGNPTSGTGTPGGSTGTGGTGGTGTGTGFMSGQTGQTFGGAGVVGVEPVLQKQSILSYKKKTHYNEWEFTYSPLQDMKQMSGGNAGIGQPAGNLNGQGGGFGGSNSGFGGSNSGFGGTGGSTFGGSNSSTFGGSNGSTGGSGSGSPSPQPQPQQ